MDPASASSTMSVENRMTPAPLTISPDETCDRALAMMDAAGIDHLPVCDGKRLVGLLRRAALWDRIAALVGPFAAPADVEDFVPLVRVSGVMERSPRTIAPDAPVAAAAALLGSGCLTALPVVDEEGLVGILTAHDLLLSIADGNPTHACGAS
jgi:acetoin utilization protein AcuB